MYVRKRKNTGRCLTGEKGEKLQDLSSFLRPNLEEPSSERLFPLSLSAVLSAVSTGNSMRKLHLGDRIYAKFPVALTDKKNWYTNPTTKKVKKKYNVGKQTAQHTHSVCPA